MKLCPVCNREYTDERKFCPYDGSRLPQVAAPQESAAPQGQPLKRCPICDREYADERNFCPHDGGRLLPEAAPPEGAAASFAVKLSVLSPNGEVSEVPLIEDSLGIGRSPENGIHLSDPTVSHRHAAVRRQDGQYVILDAGSRTGTFVNGRRIGTQGQALRHGDIIIVGRTQITFSVQPTGQSSLATRPSRIERPEEIAARALGQINIVLPSGETLRAPLTGFEVSIGRGPGNEIVLADPLLSDRHAIIRPLDGQWRIMDAGSRNGVFVNGQRVGPEGKQIEPGDEVMMGKSRLSIALGPSFDTSEETTLPPEPPPAEPPPAEPPPAEPPPAERRPAAEPPPRERTPERVQPEGVGPDRAPRKVAGESTAPPEARTPGEPKPGYVIDGRYELEVKLGEDPIATLYRARRILLGDKVAVRILHPELAKKPVALESFRRRAQVAARIRHPNSVQIFDFGTSAEGAVYIVEELLSGRTLRDLVAKDYGLTLPRITGILNQICGAVHTAHLNGIVLRDIKPESIFVEVAPDGKELIKVGGYGLAKVDSSISGGMTMAGQAKVLGTPQYMSPEQWLEKPLDSRSDVYSLGVILFELLTGLPPFDAANTNQIAQMHLIAPVPDITEFGRFGIDEGIAAVVNRALAKDPNLRPPTALHLAAELQAVSGGAGGFLGTFINKATGLMPIPPVVVSKSPAPVPAGEEILPSVVATAEPKGRGALNTVVMALMAEAFLSRISSGLIKTAVPLYALLVFGLNITSIMALVLIQNVVPLLLRPLFGSLADTYGKKRVFMISLAIRTLVSILYAVATLPLLFIISAIRGIADSAKGPSASAMIADNTDEKDIAKAYSWYTTTKSTSGGIGEAIAAFLLPVLIIVFGGMQTVTTNVAVLDELNKRGEPVEVIVKSPEEVGPDRTLPGTEAHPEPRRVSRVEQREVELRKVPIDDLPKVVDTAPLRQALVAIFVVSTVFSALSFILVYIFIKEKSSATSKEKRSKKEKKAGRTGASDLPEQQPNVWSFALLGTALTAPAYMVTGEFFILLAVKLDITPYALGWIKIIAETIIPLAFGPFFGWLADRIGTGRVVALRSIANLVTSLLFWMTPWFAGTALLGLMMGLARAIDEIGKAAFKPTWGAIAAKVSSFNLANRSKTMGIMEGGVDAADLTFPVLAAVLLQYLSLGALMAVRAVLALVAEVYGVLLMRKYKI